MMKKLFTLLLAAACFTASAQIEVEYPYNPDNQNDGHVGIEDILEILTVYGEEFTPEQLMVEGTSLTEWIQLLSETVIQQQAQIDSLQVTNSFNGFGPRETVSFQPSDWSFNPSFDYGLLELQFEVDGLLTLTIGGCGLNVHLLPDSAELTFFSDTYEEHNQDIHFFEQAYSLTTIVKSDEVVWLKSPANCVLDFLDWYDVSFVPITIQDSQSLAEEDDVSGPCQAEFTVNYHGYDYELVEIGDQCWFAENLRTTSYRNGEVISNENSYLESSSEAWNELNQLSPLVDGEEGHFYSLGVIQSGLDICPSGWSVPSRNDWIHLAAEIDLSLGGHFLKDSTSWNGVDTYGFGAKPTGRAFYQGYYPDWDWAYECSGAMYYQQWYQELESLLQYADECDNGNVPEGCLTFYDGINETLDSLEESGLVNFEPSLLPLSSVEDLEFLLYDGGASLTQPCGSYEEAIELFYGGFDYSYQLVEVGQSTSWWARDASAGTYNSGNVRLDGSTRINGLDSQVDGGLGMNISIRCVKD